MNTTSEESLENLKLQFRRQTKDINIDPNWPVTAQPHLEFVAKKIPTV